MIYIRLFLILPMMCTLFAMCMICVRALHDLCLTVACAYRPGYLPNCKA